MPRNTLATITILETRDEVKRPRTVRFILNDNNGQKSPANNSYCPQPMLSPGRGMFVYAVQTTRYRIHWQREQGHDRAATVAGM